jgi:hypothetical protein
MRCIEETLRFKLLRRTFAGSSWRCAKACKSCICLAEVERIRGRCWGGTKGEVGLRYFYRRRPGTTRLEALDPTRSQYSRLWSEKQGATHLRDAICAAVALTGGSGVDVSRWNISSSFLPWAMAERLLDAIIERTRGGDEG